MSAHGRPRSNTAHAEAVATASAWNAAHPTGTLVRYWTTTRQSDPTGTGPTRSRACAIGAEAIIAVGGVDSLLPLSRVEAVRASDATVPTGLAGDTPEIARAEEHLRCTLGRKAPTTFTRGALRCAALLHEWVGLHNLGERRLCKVDWTRPFVWLVLGSDTSIATYDRHDLTRLVFLAHDRAIRVSVSASRAGLALLLHPRSRDGASLPKHPTLDEAMECWRRHHTESEVTT